MGLKENIAGDCAVYFFLFSPYGFVEYAFACFCSFSSFLFVFRVCFSILISVYPYCERNLDEERQHKTVNLVLNCLLL